MKKSMSCGWERGEDLTRLDKKYNNLFDYVATMIIHEKISLQDGVYFCHKLGTEHSKVVDHNLLEGISAETAPSVSGPRRKNRGGANNRISGMMNVHPTTSSLFQQPKQSGKAIATRPTLVSSLANSVENNIDAEDMTLYTATPFAETGVSSSATTETSPNEETQSNFFPTGKFKGVQAVQGLDTKNFPGQTGYTAFVKLGGNEIFLGMLTSEESAAKVHDHAMIRIMGSKKCFDNPSLLNFPIDIYSNDSSDSFFMYDTAIRRAAFGSNLLGYKEVMDFSFLVIGSSKDVDKKRTSDDVSVPPTTASQHKKSRTANVESIMKMAKFFPSGKDKKAWGDEIRHVFVVDRRSGGKCFLKIPPLYTVPKPGYSSLGATTAVNFNVMETKQTCLRADIVDHFDPISPVSQLVILQESELSPQDKSVYDQIIKHYSLKNNSAPLPNDVDESKMKDISSSFIRSVSNFEEDTAAAAFTTTDNEQQTIALTLKVDNAQSNSSEFLESTEFSNQSHVDLSDPMQVDDDPVRDDLDSTSESTPISQLATAELSRILDGSMTREELDSMSEDMLTHIANIVLNNSCPAARQELLMETLNDLIENGSIRKESDQQHFTINNFDSFKDCLKSYMIDLET